MQCNVSRSVKIVSFVFIASSVGCVDSADESFNSESAAQAHLGIEPPASTCDSWFEYNDGLDQSRVASSLLGWPPVWPIGNQGVSLAFPRPLPPGDPPPDGWAAAGAQGRP